MVLYSLKEENRVKTYEMKMASAMKVLNPLIILVVVVGREGKAVEQNKVRRERIVVNKKQVFLREERQNAVQLNETFKFLFISNINLCQ